MRFGGKAFDWTIFHTTPADRRIPVGSCAVFTKVFMRLIAAVFYYVAAPTGHRPFSIQPAYTREGRVCFSLILRTGLASRRQCSVTALGLQSPEATARSRNPEFQTRRKASTTTTNAGRVFLRKLNVLLRADGLEFEVFLVQ